MNSILPFTSALSGASNPSHFMVLDTDAPDGGHFLSITPKLMRWNDRTYILDLSSVITYWTHLAEQEVLSLDEFLQKLLQNLPTPPRKAILADHPWKGLIGLAALKNRPNLHYVDIQSHFGRRIIHDVTWTEWIELCYELRDHFAVNSKKTVQASFSSLMKVVERMRLTHITQMADMETTAIQRRFGKLIATAWEWTWRQPQLAGIFANETFTDGFPWLSLSAKETVHIARHIETPLRHWEHIAPLLTEDFDKLCNLSCWNSSERVVSLEWVLSFSCSPSLRIPVLFRHPHALHSETGHHKTALLQAFYSWQNATKSRHAPETLGETYIGDDSITEWTLTIQERLVTTPQIRSLFRDDLSSESSELRQLENSLPVPLIEYDATDHWSPERSFTATSGVSREECKTIPFGSIAKLAMYQRRPLFIYTEPQSLAHYHESSGLIFCERIATSWWSQKAAVSSLSSPLPNSALSRAPITCRNYYLRMTNDGLLQWVFQNDDGSLSVHGIYG